ncbi:palmitoyltransferase ZDHHC2-like [Rhipicephalus microplus]|uniref:palmitoyltransferase ZDHHC2-like n=1 Tax=Rhipicephalus microplus TaxID=6941 RepID=UPI003F6C8D9D
MLPSVDRPGTLIENGSDARGGSFTKPRPLTWLPVLLVSALISCPYYAYVQVFCRPIVAEESTAKAVTFGAGFHLLLSMCIWSYAKTTATAIPDVPPAYLLSVDQEQVLANCQNERTWHGLLEMLASQKGVFTRGPDGSARYCVLCHLLKPDRCHHCSMCRRCIMKMDHHCPWFNNCVCFSTYKFFLLTLFYTVALCLYGLATLTAHLVEWWSDAWLRKPCAFHVVFLVVVGTMLAVALGSFFVMHLFMASKNETTLERLRDATFKELRDSFDLGNRYENFVEVFGPRKSLWMIPAFTSVGDGVRFPTRLHST